MADQERCEHGNEGSPLDRLSPLTGTRWPDRHDGEALWDYVDRVARWADGWQ